MEILASTIDRSVNFVKEAPKGFFESRYVRKIEDYFICYLSSQTGCNRGCRFCHLTATGQTQTSDVDVYEYLHQAYSVMEYYRSQPKAKYMHYNFMARGEALDNQYLVNDSTSILTPLAEYAASHNLFPKFNISTIMPRHCKKSLTEIFRIVTPTIYYSMYSADDAWRKAWLPAGLSNDDALRQLKDYQDMTKKVVKIHGSFIKDENDSLENAYEIAALIKKYGLSCEFNLVRYNPYSELQGEESSEERMDLLLDILSTSMNTKVIPRVGFDVKASCGMFVE